MNKVFLFALQLVGVLAPFWRSMQALLWANSGRASEGALWNIVYCGGPLLIACALARWRILKGKETFSLIQAACGVLLALLVSTFFIWVGASERGIPPVSAYGLAVDGVIYAAGLALPCSAAKNGFRGWAAAIYNSCKEQDTHMRFVDEAVISVKAGKGGNGCVSFRQ